jgi:hypothetical protein
MKEKSETCVQLDQKIKEHTVTASNLRKDMEKMDSKIADKEQMIELMTTQ